MESTKFYILLFIIALLAVKIYQLEYKISTMRRENMTDSQEGIDSIISMFNNGVIKATSIETTDGIKCGGSIVTSGNITTNDIATNNIKCGGSIVASGDMTT